MTGGHDVGQKRTSDLVSSVVLGLPLHAQPYSLGGIESEKKILKSGRLFVFLWLH